MTNPEKRVKRTAKRWMEDKDLNICRHRLADLDEFFNDSKYFEGMVEWALEELEPKERAKSASMEVQREFRDRIKPFLEGIETAFHSALKNALDEEGLTRDRGPTPDFRV
jgi:hypothetical protein